MGGFCIQVTTRNQFDYRNGGDLARYIAAERDGNGVSFDGYFYLEREEDSAGQRLTEAREAVKANLTARLGEAKEGGPSQYNMTEAQPKHRKKAQLKVAMKWMTQVEDMLKSSELEVFHEPIVVLAVRSNQERGKGKKKCQIGRIK